MHSIPLELAKQKLIFYVAQDLDQSIRSNVQQLVNEVAASRIWSVTPPSFIDEIDDFRKTDGRNRNSIPTLCRRVNECGTRCR